MAIAPPFGRITSYNVCYTKLLRNGGAIAIGHPLGCSGARLALTVAREMQQSGARYAAVSLCIGVGQGLAVILEKMN